MNRRHALKLAARLAAVAGTAALGWCATGPFLRSRAHAKRVEELRRITDSIVRVDASGKVAQLGMGGFLRFWSDAVVTRLRHARFPLDRLQSDIVTRGSLLLPPAAPEQIDALGQTFGIEVPGSLRALYLTSNGLMSTIFYANETLALLPVERVRWLHEFDRDMVDAWSRDADDPPDAEYFRYGPTQDVARIRTSYLRRMICLAPLVDGAALMLNPAVRFTDGELEAWDFSVKYPGAQRHRNLGTMLEARCAADCWELDYSSATHDWRRAGQTSGNP